MADYREISQQYAQNGIRASILINAGAAVALLSQTDVLIRYPSRRYIILAMLIWAFGVLAGAFTWLLAFASTRYVDKSENEAGLSVQHLQTSDAYMYGGIAAVIFSFVCFALGCIMLGRGIAWKFP